MFGVIATLRVEPARTAAFESCFTDFARTVLGDEPGTLSYCLDKSQSESCTYRAIEIYEIEAAFNTHAAAEAFQAFRPTLLNFLIEPPSSERKEIVV